MNRTTFLSSVAAAALRPTRVAFRGIYASLGDSTTADPNLYATTPYPTLLARRFDFDLKALGVDDASLNTVAQRELPYVPSEAKLLTMGIGINDARFKQTYESFSAQYQATVAYLVTHAPSALLLYSTCIVNPYPPEPAFELLAAQYNKFLRAFRHPRARLVDIDAMPDPGNPALRALRFPGPNMVSVAHPNNAGHALIADAFAKVYGG
jgi:lysophospholipase L1-like esterase